MILQWTQAQVHDTVAAIVAQGTYHAERRSLARRLLQLIADKIDQLLRAVRGSLDARVVIAVAVVIIVLVVAIRVVIDRRAAERRARNPSRARGGDGRRDAWTEARLLADAGNFAEASHALYIAAIDALTVANVVRYHRSKTAGDYARDLRRSGSPIAADFRLFGRAFDRLAFGQAPVSREDYDKLVALAERIIGFARRPVAA